MQVIQQITLACFETALLVLYLNSILITNFERRKQKAILFICYFIFQCFTYFLDSTFFSTSIYYIIFTLFIAWYCYIDDIRIILMSSGMFVTLNYASKLLSMSILVTYTHGTPPTNPFTYVLDEQMQSFACTIVLVILIFMIIMRKIQSQINKIIIDIIIFSLPLINLFLSMHILSHEGNLYQETTLLLFSYSFLLFFVIDQIIYSTNAKQVSDAMTERLAQQQIYYHDIQAYSNQASRIRHDMKNNLSTISYLLHNKKYDQATAFIDDYIKQTTKYKAIINTGNDVVDVILNTKMKVAQEAGITINHDIVIPPSFKISSVDISIILGNLLDNSIEAASKLTDNKNISIKIQTYKDSLFIAITNTFNGKVILFNEGLISTKKEGRSHGLGLGNVSNIIKKNKGTIDISYDEETFSVSILIPNAV